LQTVVRRRSKLILGRNSFQRNGRFLIHDDVAAEFSPEKLDAINKK